MAKNNNKPIINKNTKQNTTNTKNQHNKNNIPKSTHTNGERDGRGVRTPTVGEPVKTSFDERTSAVQPFLKADGTQDNGAADLSQPEGARATTAREGDKTTVEETEKAIKEGSVEGPQNMAELNKEDSKPKNPVK